MPPRKAPEVAVQRVNAAPQTPPRKRPRPSEVDGVSSDAKASANAPGSAGPQVIFSPGKRVQADGHKHDAGAEVRGFLRHQGYSDQEIRGIMASEAGSTRRQARAPAAPQPAAAGPAAAPRRFADLAAVPPAAAGAGGDADDFAADLLDVLGMDDEPPAAQASAPAAEPPAASPPAAAEPAAASPRPSPPLLSQLPAGLGEDLCAAADRIDAEVASQRSQQASQHSPVLSQMPPTGPGRPADFSASADEIDRLVDDEAVHCTQGPPLQASQPFHGAARQAAEPAVPLPRQLPMSQAHGWQPAAAPPTQSLGGWTPGMPAPLGMATWQQNCMPRPATPAWGQQPAMAGRPAGPYGTMPVQAGGCAAPGQQPWGVQQAQPMFASQQPPLHFGRPPFGQQTLPVQPVGRAPVPCQPLSAGPGACAPAATASQGSLLDDYEDDDEALLASIVAVEEKVKREQNYEKILKEREEELNLELMLVDVDPNEC